MRDIISLEEVRQKTIGYIYYFFASLLLFYMAMGWSGIVPLKPLQYLINFINLATLLLLVWGYRRRKIGYTFVVNAGVVLGLLHIAYTLYVSTYNELRILWFFPWLLFAYLYGSRRVGVLSTVLSLGVVFLPREALAYSTSALMTYFICILTISVVSLFFISKFQEMSRLVLETQNRLTRHASYDYLTGVLNRRGFFETVDGRSRGVIVVLDVDHFKDVNDRYGHAVGDEFLKHLVTLLQRSLRKKDRIARFGGDEFVVLFHDATPENIDAWFERFYRLLRAHPFRTEGVELPLSVSAGVATLEGSLDEALEAADRNLYRAKKERGRWCDAQSCHRPA